MKKIYSILSIWEKKKKQKTLNSHIYLSFYFFLNFIFTFFFCHLSSYSQFRSSNSHLIAPSTLSLNLGHPFIFHCYVLSLPTLSDLERLVSIEANPRVSIFWVAAFVSDVQIGIYGLSNILCLAIALRN